MAQEYSYVDYTVKDGLAGSTVYGMALDKEGFLWFATETGLSRFDGIHFRNFYMSDGLPDNEVLQLFVDSRNRVWIIPFKYSICYYLNGKIHNQENDALLRKLTIRSEIVNIIEDAAGNIIIAEKKAIHLLSADGTITDIDEFGGKAFDLLQAGINKEGKCRIFLQFVAVIETRLDKGKLVYEGTIHIPGPNNSSSTYISPQLRMIESGDSLLFFDIRGDKRFTMRMPKGFINISRLNDSSLTLNAYSGALLLDIRHRKIIDSFLSGQTVSGVLEDPDGGLWFSTLGGGIHRLATRNAIHYSFRRDNTLFPVFSILKVDSALYVGTDRFYLWTSVNNGRTFRSHQIYNRFSRGRVITIVQAGEKKIIAGTDGGTFSIEKGGEKSWLMWQRGAVKAMSVISDTTFMEITGISARIMRLTGGDPLDTLWPGRSTCGCLQNDSCYIGTLTGLYALSLAKRSARPEELFRGGVSAVQASPDGVIWAATYGEGLVLYKNDREVRRITVEDGLTSNICRYLFIGEGNVWVGTDKGLNKITLSKDAVDGYKIIHFTSADGLSSNIINTVFVKGKKVYVGTPEGMTVLNEDKIVKSGECLLRLTDITIAGKDWPLDTANFTLPHKENDLQFEYVGISYQSEGAIHYRYRLLGADERWKTTDQTFLHYPSLPPGQYVLEMVAINKSGETSNTLQLPFAIDKPLWEKNWMRALFILAAGGLIWLVFYQRVRAIRRKEAEKSATATRIAELEQMALRSQMNPHFIFNSLNSIQLFVMEKDVRGANEYITHFSRLIRQTLDISAKAAITLQEETDYLSTYLELEKRRFEYAFDYTLSVDAELNKRELSIPPMILQPYVENAIVHGIAHRIDKKGYITIKIESDFYYLICTVEDNGVGREVAALYKSRNPIQYPSKGMQLTAKRIAILNSTMKNPISTVVEDIAEQDGETGGTRVIVRFPLDL
ncbi:hypothetical protein GCM10011511_21690 [Puia dinghuensis]|uniref:Signal transduction histidine kinase internal region domain-containing protein n=1 Tax=Puia dinghuensis TaxID=1792502 RepID=A0A8J2UCU7_9BACT|nr:hypothetical protein GCM10011511_21690 [Puia dinghuensis]